jgi:diguanylate cyclase (GGDEF)-like protein
LGRTPKFLQSGRQSAEFYTELWKTVESQGFWSGEIWNRRKNGEVYPEWLSISLIRNAEGEATHYIGAFSDISLLKQQQKQLEQIAYYDPLTGVPNRVLLADRMQQALAQTQRDNACLAVGYLDLDGFKQVNDVLGHEAGDHLLIEITRRIRKVLRATDTVARMGGDEFAFLLPDLSRAEECEPMLERMLHAIAMPVSLGGQSAGVSASIGVSLYPYDPSSPEVLLRHADQAMYQAKQSGKNRFHIHDPKLDRRLHLQHETIERVERALERNEFELHYQPKIDLHSGRLLGAEALIRWPQPKGVWIGPAEFLPHIAKHRLAANLDYWVLDAALGQASSWRKQGLAIPISVNLSNYTLRLDSFAEDLHSLLSRHPQVDAELLELEIPESAAQQCPERIAQTIARCRCWGVRFTLDDFGVGIASLNALKMLPVQTLKIDRAFVSGMLKGEEELAIVRALIALARAFHLEVVAEGLESERQDQCLLELGCHIAQGYRIAKAMPGQELPRWANAWQAARQPLDLA